MRVVAQGGDGGTTDIGLGCLSGMFERNDDVLYICYDNEAYMNTGVQRSGATPRFASASRAGGSPPRATMTTTSARSTRSSARASPASRSASSVATSISRGVRM